MVMPTRNMSERDFELKANVRRVLWAQGYSTRLDVLLAYALDPRGASQSGRAGLTDLDVLGVRLLPGFHVHTAIADCKTSRDRVPERLFWLAGVSQFFGSDVNLLVRSQPIPQHAIPLARSLGLTLVGPDDLTILGNTYPDASGLAGAPEWYEFFSPELLGVALERLSRLPEQLRHVKLYREAHYWLESPHVRLQRIVGALGELAKDGSRGTTFQLVFADFVWLYVLALWSACQSLAGGGISKIDRSLHVYLNGNEDGLRNLLQVRQGFEALARQANVEVHLSTHPPYFRELLDVIGRCLRRPEATGRMARRAEWVVLGQMIGDLGPPTWSMTEDDLFGDKLLGDVARFLVRASGLDDSFLEKYHALLYGSTSSTNQSTIPLPEAESDTSSAANQGNLEAGESEVQSHRNAESGSIDRGDEP